MRCTTVDIQPEADRLELEISDPTAESAGIARTFARNSLARMGDVPSGVINDAEVVVSELVTNVLRHAMGPCEVHLSFLTSWAILICVHDQSEQLPELRDEDWDNETGRGLHIVEHLTAEFGFERFESGGKVVWAKLKY